MVNTDSIELPTRTQEQELEAGIARMRAYLEVHKWMVDGLGGNRLTDGERYCLASIGTHENDAPEEGGALTEKMLSLDLRLSPASINDSVRFLVKQGYVMREGKEGERNRPLRLTSKGKHEYQGLCLFVEANVQASKLYRNGMPDGLGDF